MSEWKEYRLGDVCNKIGSGATPRGGGDTYLVSGEYALIRSQNVLDFTFSYNGLAYINEEQAIKLKNVEVKKTDVLLNITGDSVGRVCQAPHRLLPARVNQHVAIIRSDEKIIFPDFLKYYLLNPIVKEYLLMLSSSGGTRNAITKGMIEDLKISAPDLPTQTAIAEILSSLDDKIELNNKINLELEQLAQTLFKQWFIDFEFPNENGEPYKSSGGEMVESELGEIPKGWEVGRLDDLIEFNNGYAFSSKELEDVDLDDCYHVFKMGHIKKGGGLNANGTKSWYNKSKAIKLSKYVLKKGDLLMCMTDMKGNVALLGHTALMNEDDKYIVNQRVGLLRPNNQIGIDYPYLYILTNSKVFIEELRTRANSGVQVNLSTSEIKSSKIILPPKNINIEYDKIVKGFFESIFNNTKENQQLTNLRDTLLPKLISGELAVSSL
jgi:type I restriction enzyme S subunit